MHFFTPLSLKEKHHLFTINKLITSLLAKHNEELANTAAVVTIVHWALPGGGGGGGDVQSRS